MKFMTSEILEILEEGQLYRLTYAAGWALSHERLGDRSDRETPSGSLDLEKLKAVLTGRLRHESLAALFNITASGKSTALDRFTCTN